MAIENPHKTVDLSVIYWRTLRHFSGKNALYPTLFFLLQDLSPLFVFKSSLCQLVVPRPDAAEQFITIITTGTILNCTSLHFFFSVRKMFWTAFYTAGHPDVMENPLAVNNVFFRREKIIYFIPTKHPGVF